jgi:hypothetical protein
MRGSTAARPKLSGMAHENVGTQTTTVSTPPTTLMIAPLRDAHSEQRAAARTREREDRVYWLAVPIESPVLRLDRRARQAVERSRRVVIVERGLLRDRNVRVPDRLTGLKIDSSAHAHPTVRGP